MKKYIVCAYNKILGNCLTRPFDNKKQALKFLSENKFIDKIYNDEKNWLYKIVEVEFYE